jgi:hypothetical protein
MDTTLSYLLLTAVLLTPLLLVAALAYRAHRVGHLRWNLDQFRFHGPMSGSLFEDDADMRRISHDADAVRTRFEHHPSWPRSGALGERR